MENRANLAHFDSDQVSPCRTLDRQSSRVFGQAVINVGKPATSAGLSKHSFLARYVSCLTRCSMQQTGGAALSSPEPSSDIIFACANCSSSFVVDSAAAGMTLNCQKCGHPTTVPHPTLEAATEGSTKLSELQHQLKENESQRTEITSYINQLGIQLHRWQLRLQTLNERQQKLQAELAAIGGPSTS